MNSTKDPIKHSTATDGKPPVIRCCIEFKTHEMGIYGYEYDDCKSKAMYMVKAGSYDSEKFHPMCKKHRDMYKRRVNRAKEKFDIKLIYEENKLQ